MGEVMEKIIGSNLLSEAEETLVDIFAPFQLGIAVKNGCQIIVKTIHAIREKDAKMDTMVLDATNAFNSASRCHALEQIEQLLPFAAPFIYATHSKPSRLFVRPENGEIETVLSQKGARQGNTLGPLVFCFAILPLLRKIQEVHKIGTLQAFIDDITLHGPAQEN
jgi:hypothetical protein